MALNPSAYTPGPDSGINTDSNSPQFGMLIRPSTTPSSTPNPTTTPDTERYSRLPPGATEGEIDAARAAQYETKDPAQAAADYRNRALQEVQDRINNITKVYGERLESELAIQAPVNQNNLNRTNSLSALMGLGGSSSAATRTAKTEQDNATINRNITAKNNVEKMEALERIYGEIDSGASKAAQAQLETNKANQAKLLEDIKNNATSQVQALASTLAGTGKTFDDWVSADSGDALKKIMDQTGQSEYQIRVAWNNSIPENLRPTIHTSYIDDGKGGTIMRQVTFDPVSKKAESKDYQLSVPASTFNGPEKPIEGKNGELFVRQSDGSYKDVSPNAENNKLLAAANLAKKQADVAKALKKTTPSPRSTNPPTPSNKFNEKVATQEMTKKLSGVVGADGFISPQDYTIARNAWIQQGGNATTFDTKFKGYRNPNNPYYVVTKEPAKKTTPASVL